MGRIISESFVSVRENVSLICSIDIILSTIYLTPIRYRLYAVGDISCDVNGSIEFLEKTTTIDKPFFSYNPDTKEVSDEISKDGIAVMGVDILPTELSVESSNHFGEALMPLLRQLIGGGFSKDDDVYEKLPPELVSVVIFCIVSITIFCTILLFFHNLCRHVFTLCPHLGECMHHSERFSHSELSIH